ncbi:hypothetical protein [Dyadobacter fermentans]|jgi:hypothetical protein|uniref:hypothetical protein n=1 Tax=Dyadobacter fermentans TaxID=94254 RepID=UPI001CBD35C4|nr:hypothetical protein [Dyadobacter fermentans]MBZ1357748.1 hypothetical protein [Dyadobacter fermentans]
MKKKANNYEHIHGWGIDADPLDVPSYPMKHRTENDNKGMIWERPAQQAQLVEILHSNERPTASAVFGSANPPAGLSGKLRRFAFKFSESTWTHWLALLVADRVNMIEGIGQDLKSGHIPDLFTEHGGRSELKYNKAGLIKKVAAGFAVATLVIVFNKIRSRKN